VHNRYHHGQNVVPPSLAPSSANAQQQHLSPSSGPAGFPAGISPSTVVSFGGTAANGQQQHLRPGSRPAGPAGGPATDISPSTVVSFGHPAANAQHQHLSPGSRPAGFPAGISSSTVVSFGRTAANAQHQHLSPGSGPAGFPAGISSSTVVSFGHPAANAQQQPSGSAGGLAVNLARAAVIEAAPKRIARSTPKKRQIHAPLGCTVPGAVADPRFRMPPSILPTTALNPLSPSMVGEKQRLQEALSLVPESWKEPPGRGERFINLEAAMDRIQGYGLWCGFAADCVNPQGVESSRFQCAHADVTVQLPESRNYCPNTRAMGCAFTITIVKIKRSGGEYEICEFLLLSVSSCA
jgi:hypothetical protein